MVTHRKRLEYYDRAALAVVAQKALTPLNKVPLAKRMTLTATLYVWAKSDPDNAASRMKWVIDSLVRTGLLVDDNEEWLDLKMPKQVVDRKNMRVEIQLKEAE